MQSVNYWDGGIVSNSPREQVIERCGAAGKRIVAVDLFPHSRPLPTNLMEVFSRRDEIVYSERIRPAGHERDLLHNARKLVEGILSVVGEPTAARIRELPPHVQLMGAPQSVSVTRIVRPGTEQEMPGRELDFLLQSIEAFIAQGLGAGRQPLERS